MAHLINDLDTVCGGKHSNRSFQRDIDASVHYGSSDHAFLSRKALKCARNIGFFDAFLMTLDEFRDAMCPACSDPRSVGIAFSRAISEYNDAGGFNLAFSLFGLMRRSEAILDSQ